MTARDNDLTTRELMLRVNKRLTGASIASAGVSVMLALALFSMLPLKETVPYIVEVDKSGEVRVPPQAPAERFTVTDEIRRFFVKRWIVDAFTINQYTMVRENDPRARAMLRGANVLAAYDEQMQRDQKFQMLARNSALVRDVAVESLMPVAGTQNAMVATVALHTRDAGQVVTQRRMVTVYFDIFPVSDRKEIDVSPVGLFITDFKVSDA
jgi:type IV secretory pathway component VirB8